MFLLTYLDLLPTLFNVCAKANSNLIYRTLHTNRKIQATESLRISFVFVKFNSVNKKSILYLCHYFNLTY
jgi:hypothetical protein